jgi:nucleotide-binding universal stress UspA family protein
MFQRILVPLDGSKIAEAALEPARHLARLESGEIELVRSQLLPVNLENSQEFPIAHETYEKEAAHCLQYLNDLVSQLEADGIKATAHVLPGGDAATRILEAARQGQADLILLTSQGRSGLGKLMLGSVADKLSRIATCPVMIVGRNAQIVPG